MQNIEQETDSFHKIEGGGGGQGARCLFATPFFSEAGLCLYRGTGYKDYKGYHGSQSL